MLHSGKVETKIEEGIATITFFHPQSNSLPSVLLQELANSIISAGNNTDAKVIILQSEGEKVFCSGASFDELASINNIEDGKKFFSGFASVLNAMRKAPKFIITRAQGKVVGGGVGIASAADYVFAHESASVKLSELSIAIGPFVVGPAVERKIGFAAFSQLAINATEWHSAQWAKEKGLFANVFSSREELDNAVQILAEKLSKSNPEAMMLMKKMFWKGLEDWDTLLTERAEISGRLVLSDFAKRAIAKFKAERK